ncbi:MAG TPA: helix-turn-helix transcriptional regulator [Vicinamibacteria bacterium]|jgi:transcriptional regulator with XRE-family HTH domain
MPRARQLPLWPTARAADHEVLDGRTVLAANLKALREQRSLSQAALAERAGLNRSYLGAIEHGRHNVPLDTVCRLAWALGREPRDLLSAIAPPPSPPRSRRRGRT